MSIVHDYAPAPRYERVTIAGEKGRRARTMWAKDAQVGQLGSLCDVLVFARVNADGSEGSKCHIEMVQLELVADRKPARWDLTLGRLEVSP